VMASVSGQGVAVSEPLVGFLLACYLAFQLGYYREAERASGDEGEAARLNAAAARYGRLLRERLETRREATSRRR
jgi:hypothetical protein